MPIHIGSCIYCGSDDRLTDEHVIPLALNGNLVLQAASCEPCRVVTSKFETALLRGGFRSAREAFKYQTRTKERPKTLPLFGVEGVEDGRKDIELDDYPVTLIMPRPAGPTIDEFPLSFSQDLLPWAYSQPNFELLSTKHGIRQFASNSLDTHAFYRTLAKIAHGCAVAHIGQANFVPFLRPLILDESFTGFKSFIGTLVIEAAPLEEPGFEVEVGWSSIEDREYVECRIRLFPELNTPWYRVIAGASTHSDAAAVRGRSATVDASSNELASWRLHLTGTKKVED